MTQVQIVRDVMISVIIPIYNGEKYLRKCIDSILVQSYKDFEIICVNDGSTDQTNSILMSYEIIDERVKVITQDNCGVVTARLNGVNNAKGKYITFIDADDYIYPQMLDYMLMHIGDTDLVTVGIEQETKTKKVCITDGFSEGKYLLSAYCDDEYFYENMLRYMGADIEGIMPFSVAKLYRKEIMKKVFLKLDTAIHYAEDRELVYLYALEMSSVVITHKPLYFYRYNEESVLRKENPYVLDDLGRLYRNLKIAFGNHLYSSVLIHQLKQVISSRLYLMTNYMGFDPIVQTVRYIMPYFEGINNRKLVLYGAGVVGCNYYNQTKGNQDINWILWVDKMVRNELVSDVSLLTNTEFDRVVIAVKDMTAADQIRTELTTMGIPDEKILWKQPISLAE